MRVRVSPVLCCGCEPCRLPATCKQAAEPEPQAKQRKIGDEPMPAARKTRMIVARPIARCSMPPELPPATLEVDCAHAVRFAGVLAYEADQYMNIYKCIGSLMRDVLRWMIDGNSKVQTRQPDDAAPSMIILLHTIVFVTLAEPNLNRAVALSLFNALAQLLDDVRPDNV